MICMLVMTYAKTCMGFGWARTFECALEGEGDPATTVVKAVKKLIHWSSGKAHRLCRTGHKL